MSIEALKKMYQLLLTEPHAPTVCEQLERIAREALAQPEQEPVANYCKECLTYNGHQEGCSQYTTPPQPEQEPVAWMEGESVYWHTNQSLNDWIRANGTPLYTAPPQRTWVGLTDEDKAELDAKYGDDTLAHLDAVEAKLKEKNT